MNAKDTITKLLIVVILLLNGCSKTKPTVNEKKEIADIQKIKEHTSLAVLWQQNAAEYKALCIKLLILPL
ncbi:hypothetical protein [Tenacibaculum sp. SG-28]|uniref:hypothetical protein n=1 Tax=Tenacibaculum sp. SG-28 TaxID=754426 RepID=UPI000CF3C976|nr:hypothetical protein [Tenacibaculum sp. SG-28]